MGYTPMQMALKLALGMFSPGTTSKSEIEENCRLVLEMLSRKGAEVPDLETLIEEVESRVVVWQPRSTSLEDRTGHQEWLSAVRHQQDWPFWDRYRRYLEQEELLPPRVIMRLDESTDRVLGWLESPHRPGQWDRRGIVVGQVQSGKTGHYTGLICKAADAGYKLIVVLAGMHNSLRSQTQLRLDEGLLGFDSQYQYRYDAKTQSRIGVGLMPGADSLKIGSLTTSIESGDFKKTRARDYALPIADMPVLLVVKKHGGILDNLIRWVTQMHGAPVSPGATELVVQDIPLLVIDDEADNASVNTKGSGEDPTTINRRIRELLKVFDKSAYVGYTATPFANIFISTQEDDDYGLDLFPRHFVESLEPPVNYFGPVRVFGLSSRDGTSSDPLPIFREIDDHADWIPDRHKPSWRPPEDSLPVSLRRALLSFFLVCAARRQRGQETCHNSMLVHTTRFNNVQAQVRDQVEGLLTNLRYRLRYGDGDATSIWAELEALWEDDFVKTTSRCTSKVKPVEWQAIQPHVQPAVDKIVVRTINGASSDALSYYENRDNGLSVIAIGGDKLSRGLTLEGLSVSYYLRASRMYDTLMQMGRWFGYRPGYEDLCRLYTTLDLRDWYTEITAASEELRGDLDDMAARSGTPEDYGLRVLQSPAGLSVTSPTKMRLASTVSLTFSGEISETVTFSTAPETLDDNWRTLENFIGTLRARHGTPEPASNGNFVWAGVPGVLVADEFFQNYRAEKTARRVRPELIRSYIADGIEVGELTEWTVVLVNNRRTTASRPVAGITVGLTLRSPLEGTIERQRYRIRRVVNPPDEFTDLTDAQRARGLQDMQLSRPERATGSRKRLSLADLTGPPLRRQREPHKALLLLYPLTPGPDHEPLANPPVGFAVSFPVSERIRPRTYQVNEIWTLVAFDDLEDDPDDQ